MKATLLVTVLFCLAATPAGAIAEFAVGPYFGGAVPIVNDLAESGSAWGIQGRVNLLSWVALGGHFNISSFGNPQEVFFEGTANEFTAEIDGGSATTFAADLYLGRSGGSAGVNFYLVGSVGSFSWDRDQLGEITKTTYSVGPGLEIVLPMHVGLEGRAMLEVVPTDNDGSWKNLLWFVGANYHFGAR